MIIYIIIGLLLAMIGAWVALPTRWLKITVGGLLTILVVCLTVQLTLTFTDHLGMRQVTTVSTKQIYSAAGQQSPAGILVADPVGKADPVHQVLVYQDTPTGKAKAHFVPNQKHLTESFKRQVKITTTAKKNATLTTKTTRWQWRSKQAERWLNVGQAGELVKEVNIVHLPQDTWVTLSTKQMQQLPTLMTQAASEPASQMARLPAEEQAKLTVSLIKQQLTPR
ncbi:DUF4811 domain-containing protein [Limosilactobacillus ingluviei]|uniref:DUF4811 domain-containing protein n=1 Tax=Limosilactobacillus ingluviei TaxID=148604 RepID=UPI00030A69DA|nr:DUF4811 domain-containing protein [Limosilactobacillus ingluviei]